MENNNRLIFKKENYILMITGVLFLVVGFIVMSMETAPYGFGFLGLTLGPILLFIGFAIQFVAILYKPKNKE